MTSRVVAIDGPAGSGKSTTAEAVAQRLGVPHVESGALYRALTLAALDAGVPLSGQRLVALAESLPVRFSVTEGGFRPEVAGADVSGAIRAPRVTEQVSEVAALPEVRTWANREQRSAVARHPRGAVLDGRDIGTVVFPDAAVKFFLTAAPEERARRRLVQDGFPADPDAIGREARRMAARDQRDAERPVAPLKPAADAHVLDTTGMDFDRQVEIIVGEARKALGW